MTQVMVIPQHPQGCAGCLGHGGCWVCLASGVIDDGLTRRPCHRCDGTGLCGEQGPVTVLPDQRKSPARPRG
jgi:hypothetical protein